MITKPSACLKDEYKEIYAFCHAEGQPVFLTGNDEGELVVMSTEAYNYREEILNLKEKLLEAEAQRINGEKTYSLDEINGLMESLINEGQ